MQNDEYLYQIKTPRGTYLASLGVSLLIADTFGTLAQLVHPLTAP